MCRNASQIYQECRTKAGYRFFNIRMKLMLHGEIAEKYAKDVTGKHNNIIARALKTLDINV